MNISLLLSVGKSAKECFSFLQDYGYIIAEDEIINTSELKLVYINNIVNKKVDIRVYNYDDVKRFFLNAFIIKRPYLTVNDLIDMVTYFNKNNIKHPDALEGNQRNIENANKYIEAYVDLFKEHATELITTDKQFPHYYPERT